MQAGFGGNNPRIGAERQAPDTQRDACPRWIMDHHGVLPSHLPPVLPVPAARPASFNNMLLIAGLYGTLGLDGIILRVFFKA